jgi:competence protein ComEC
MNMLSDRTVSIKGRLIYFAAVSLLGLLSVLESHVIYGGLLLLAILFLLKYKKSSLLIVFLLFGCYVIYFASGYYEKMTFNTHFAGKETDFLILFENDIRFDGNVLSAYAVSIPTNEEVAVRYRIKTEKEKKLLISLLNSGIACEASGTLEKPSPARNPNAFNYQLFLNRKQITWILNIDHLNAEKCQSRSGGFLTALKSFRQKEITSINNNFPQETAALAAALLFGERDLFNPETERSYQKIGVVHLLAISGLHVGLLAGMVYFTCLRIGITKEKTEFILLAFLPVYAIVSGLAPPVLRAAAMLMLLIGARRFNLRLTPLDAISIAFMLLSFIEPNLIYDIGFQLSFSVSFSLVISASKILTAFTTYIKQTAAASFIAQLSSLPVILNSFYEVSVISIIANLLFVPLFSILLLPLLLVTYIVFLLFGIPPDYYLNFLEGMVHHINNTATILADVPGSTLIIGKPGKLILILQIILIPLFFFLWESSLVSKFKPQVWIFLIPLVPLFIQIFLPVINPYGKVIFLDVGQGDSILIKMPFNKGNYLIDTGGVFAFERGDWKQRREEYDPGKDIVLPLLKSEGIGTLDKLILTHGDADHIAGAAALFGEIRVKQLILPRETDRSVLEKDIIKRASEEGADIYFGGSGTVWKTTGGEFIILNPVGERNDGDRNERSIVLYADIGGKKWLFTGDLGHEGEKDFVENYSRMDIDVLKVGHHGSKYSSSQLFIESIKPEYAIISVGEKNRYGHPGKEVIERLDSQGSRTFRTDINGAVFYRFKGDSGTFFTQIP